VAFDQLHDLIERFALGDYHFASMVMA